MRLGRIRARPSCTVLVQPACMARVRPSLAQLCGARQRGTPALRRWPHRRAGGGRGKLGGGSPARGRRRGTTRGVEGGIE
jgi:hypothetical protein